MSFIEWSWLITLELKHNLSSQQDHCSNDFLDINWFDKNRWIDPVDSTLDAGGWIFEKAGEKNGALSEIRCIHRVTGRASSLQTSSSSVLRFTFSGSPEWSRWPSVRSNIWKWGGWTTWNFDNSFPTQSSPPPVTHCLPQSSMLQQLLSIFTNACIISIDLKQFSSCPAFTCFIRAQLQSKAGKVWSQTLLPPKCYQSVRSRQCPPWFVTCLPDTAWPRFSL